MISRTLLHALAILGILLPWQLFAATPEVPPLPTPPPFLDRVKSEADLEKLTPDEKKELETYLASILPGPALPASSPAPEGTTNCFDDYRFGSVQADLSTNISSTVPGATLAFSGTVANDNPYPIVNARVFVKIFRKQSDDSLAHQNGHHLVDAFIAADHLSVPGKGTLPYSFSWKVPAHAIAGEYEATTFVVTSERFNLLGLSFTDDVTGNKTSFTVASKESAPYWNKNTVTLNDRQYRFAAFPPHFTKEEGVAAMMDLVNPDSDPRSVTLTYKLYNWDSQRKEHLLDTWSDTLTIQGKTTKRVAYSATKYQGAVSLLVAEAKTGDTTSLLFIRFVRDGIPEARINFPSLTAYPLTEGMPNALFSCLHATNVDMNDMSLTVSLTDPDGSPIHSYTYEGRVTGAMMGTKEAFTPTKNHGTVVLSTTLKQGETVLDSVTETYDCALLAPEACQFTKEPSRFFPSSPSSRSGTGLFLLALLLVALAIATVLALRRIRQSHTPTPPATPMAILAALIVLSGLLLPGVGEGATNEKTMTWNTTAVPQLFYYWNFNYPYPNHNVTDPSLPYYGWAEGLQANANVTVTYRAALIDDSTGSPIPDGSVIPPLTRIRVEWPRQDSDISWFGTGVSTDSPFGTWRINATDPADYCTNYFVNSYTFGDTYGVYIPLSVNPPAMIASGSNVSCASNICVVNNSGPVVITASFPQTYGRFYYRYSGSVTSLGASGCFVHPGIALRACSSPDSFSGLNYCDASALGVIGNTVDSTLSVPPQSITFNLSAVATNNSPSAPTCPATLSAVAGAPVTLTLSGTDPDGDPVRYGVHWEGGAAPAEWVPAAGYVPSGTSQSVTHSWATAGTYTVKSWTQDDNSTLSPSSCNTTVTVTPAPLPGLCGSADNSIVTAIPATNLCAQGAASAVTLSASGSEYLWTCLGVGGAADASCNAYVKGTVTSCLHRGAPAAPCLPSDPGSPEPVDLDEYDDFPPGWDSDLQWTSIVPHPVTGVPIDEAATCYVYATDVLLGTDVLLTSGGRTGTYEVPVGRKYRAPRQYQVKCCPQGQAPGAGCWEDDLHTILKPPATTVTLRDSVGVNLGATDGAGNITATVPNSQVFQVGMNAANADSCTYSRTTNGVPDWTNQPIPPVGALNLAATLPNYLSPLTSGWLPATYRWSFTCTQTTSGLSDTNTITLTVNPGVPQATLTPNPTNATAIPPISYFGNIPVGVATPLSLTLTNTGESGSSLTGSVALASTDGFVCTSGCGAFPALPQGGTHTIIVTVTPTFPLGLKQGTLTVTTNANDPVRSLQLNAISPFTLSTPIDFGRVVVGNEKTLAVTITNTSVANFGTGVFALTQSPDSVYFCDASAPIAKDAAGCHYDLGPGRSTTLTLRFAPLAARSYTDGEGIPIGNYELDPNGVPLNGMIWTIAGVGVPPVSGFREQ